MIAWQTAEKIAMSLAGVGMAIALLGCAVGIVAAFMKYAHS